MVIPCLMSEDERQKKRNHKEVEKDLEDMRNNAKREMKLLLLGKCVFFIYLCTVI